MTQAYPLRGRLRMAFGHSFVLTPAASEMLRQQIPNGGNASNEFYSDMLFARRPGFICASCGLELHDFVHALTILCTDLLWLQEPPLAVIASRGVAVVCDWRTNVVEAELRGRPGKVIFDQLEARAPKRLVDTVRSIVGVGLDEEISAGGGLLPRLQHSY